MTQLDNSHDLLHAENKDRIYQHNKNAIINHSREINTLYKIVDKLEQRISTLEKVIGKVQLRLGDVVLYIDKKAEQK